MLSIISPYISSSLPLTQTGIHGRTSLRRKCLGVASTLKLQRAKGVFFGRLVEPNSFQRFTLLFSI